MKPILRPFPLAICVLLAIATARLPYGYYEFLRIAVTIWGIIAVIHSIQIPGNPPQKHITLLLTSGITILYNPLFPIHLDKEIWVAINLISIPIILLSTYLNHAHDQQRTME